MKPSRIDDELIVLRKKYLDNLRILKILNDEVVHSSDELTKTDERISRLESNIQQDMIEVRKNDKKITKIKEDIEERRTFNLPEKNQIRDLSGFVKASQSIFQSSVFSKEDQMSIKRNLALMGKPGEFLMDIAKISEKVVSLKKNIVELKRAQIELGEEDNAIKRIKELDHLKAEQARFDENTVSVKFTNLLGEEDSCYFPIITSEGYKSTFSDLLTNASRY